jgi:xylulokinase
MAFVLGIDLGTSACKATLLSEDGRVAAAAGGYATLVGEAGRAEQRPSDWWAATVAATRQVLGTARAAPDEVQAVGLTGQMHSLVALGSDGQVLRPAILWSDKRAGAQCNDARRLLPGLEAIIANPLIPAFTLPQLLWVRDNEPEVYRQVAHVLVPKDWLRWRMSGAFATEPSDASGTAMFDVRLRQWSSEITRGLGVPGAWLPECVPSTAVTSVLAAAPADALGLAPGSPVVAGAGDQAAQAVAMGATAPSVLGVTIGTSGVVVLTSDRPMRGAFCHALDDRWLRLNSMHAAGLSLTWYRETFNPRTPLPELVAGAEDINIGSDGLLFLPFLLGEREATEPTIPGAFVGVTARHTAPHFVRAILEGVAFEIRRMVERWTEEDSAIMHVRFSGGGAASPLWRRILADALGLPLSVTSRDASYGAAVIAGVGSDWWPSVDAAAGGFRDDVETVNPDPVSVRRLDAAFRRYVDVVHQLEHIPCVV